MHLIIDGDIVAFRAASSAYEKLPNGTKIDLPEGIARARTEESMKQLMSQLHATSHSVWISGENNFRFDLYPEYKANRKDQERPRWLEDCKEHLIVGWGAEVTDGFEADDAMAMEATARPGSVIVSIDKDLKQIPGTHFNWVKQEKVEIDELEAMYNFYWHILVGDSADNIKGCPGIGPVKATRSLSQSDDPQDWFEIVQRHYNNDEAFLLNGQLIWLWRRENDTWRFPNNDQNEGRE